MTVHDKVSDNPPPTRAFQLQVQSSQKEIFLLFMCTFERCHLQSWFSFVLLNLWRQAILFSPSPAFPPREVHQNAPLSFPLYSHTYIFSASFLFSERWYFFKRDTLSKMLNRHGTSSTLARLNRAKVIPSYISSADVLLTTIDFHLFICSWGFGPLSFLTSKQMPEGGKLLCWNFKFDPAVFLLIRISVLILPSVIQLRV